MVIAALVSPEFAESSGWNDLLVRTIFIVAFSGSIGVFLDHLNFLITFERHGITYRNFVRKKRDIPYRDITRFGLEYWGASPYGRCPYMVVYVREKKYRIYSKTVGFEYLREQLRENVGRDKEKNLAFLD